MANLIWKDSYFVLSQILAKGISEFVVCAGARNGPLVEILQAQKHLQVYNFFEERSAAFFALGRTRASGKPVAVVTTSGTAVAETLPAVIEACYQGLPLLIVSADRPQSYRGTGSPQAIRQTGFFTTHVAGTWDYQSGEPESPQSWQNWSFDQPFHFNVCLGEPGPELKIPPEFQTLPAVAEFQSQKLKMGEWVDPIIFSNLKKQLVIVGPLAPRDRPEVEIFLKENPGPRIVETLSGLSKYGQPLDPNWLLEQGICDSVLRIGAVPTLRFWRDLEEKYRNLPVYSVVSTETPWSGLSRDSFIIPGFENLRRIQIRSENPGIEMKISPLKQGSEPQLVQELAHKIQGQLVYVGNSLPVRHLDQISPGLAFKDVYGNRGVNGIDGQLSTFLGWTAQASSESWCLVGDLTALYDLSALWVTPQLSQSKRRIMVINNGGGMIFRRFSNDARFLNRHEINFSNWAKMWSWDYQRWTEIPSDLSSLPDSVVIELVPK